MFKEAIAEYERVSKNSALYQFALDNIKRAKAKIGNDCSNVVSKKNSETRPKVSVIVPVYNSEDFLGDCIHSLRNQSLKEIELIFVDDGSSDSSLNILQTNCLEDDRIIVVRQENKFAGAARNNGLKIARGEYVIFIDSDDFVDLRLLEKVYGRAKKTNAEVVVFNACEFDTQTKELRACKFPLSKDLFPKKDVFHYLEIKNKIFQANSCIPWNKFFKKELIDRSGVQFQEIKSSNDTVFIYSLLVEAQSISLLDEVLVYYRVNNPNSLQRSKSKSWECIFQAFLALKKRLEYIGCYESVKQSFINKSLRAFLYYMATVDNNTRKIMECSFVNKYYSLLEMDCIDEKYIYLKDNYRSFLSIMANKYVPIIYSCDRKYLPHTFVSIKSMEENLSPDVKAVIHIMHDSSVTEDDIRVFCKLKSDKIAIDFINLENSFSNVKMKISHISYVTYFRLKIHEKLGFYDKIIYLDSDTVVNSDINELYSIDISDFYVAGVKAIAFNNKKHENRLLADVSKYINAGVLLLNTKKIIESGIYERFPILMENGYSCQDQDIINVAFNGKIKNIDKSFNFMTKYIEHPGDAKDGNIKILHFADKKNLGRVILHCSLSIFGDMLNQRLIMKNWLIKIITSHSLSCGTSPC